MSIPKNYVISNINHIYVYFQVINQTEPESIIDYGMFLKRIGAVSRNVRGECIPDTVSIYGVDIAKDIDLPVYNTIYDKIYDLCDFHLNCNDDVELGILLCPDNFISKESLDRIISFSKEHTKRLFVDKKTYDLIKTYISSYKAKNISSENETYYLIYINN